MALSRSGQRTTALGVLVAFACLGLSNEGVMAQKVKLEELDRYNFDRFSTTIDNKWMPLQPGTQFVHEGSTQEGKKRIPRRLVFTVTDLVKVINGVRAVVGYEVDFRA